MASTGHNPLHEFFTPPQLVRYARDFVSNLGRAVEEEVFVKGGLYFQEHDNRNLEQPVSELRLDPGGFPELDLTLKEPEVESIEIFETQRRWKKFLILWRTSAYRQLLIACWLAAIAQGMCQSMMNGANLFWPAALDLDISDIANNPLATNSLIFGLINGAPFLVGAFSGFLFTDPISNTKDMGQGRRSVLILASIITIAASIGSALVRTWQELLICRLVLGIGMGSKATIVPILLSEIAPPDLRGMFVSSWQMFDALGILIGFVMTLALCGINGKNNWRYMLGSAAAPAAFLLFIAPLCVESPRWLLKREEIRKAFEALVELHNGPSRIIACGDLLYLHQLLQDETRWLMERAQEERGVIGRILIPRNQSQTGNPNHVSLGKRWSLMFATRRMRTAILVSMTVMLAQQACGINLLAFLSSNFYFEVLAAQRDDGHGVTTPPPYKDSLKILGLGCGFGAVNFLFSTLAFCCIDWKRKGQSRYLPEQINRQTLLHISFPAMALSFFIAGGVLKAGDSGVVAGFHYFLLYCFTAAYSIGAGPMAFTISAEAFPVVNREIGMGISVFWNFTGAGLLSIFAPILSKRLDHWGIFVLFGFLNLIAELACFLFVIDTQGFGLEHINQQFDASAMELLAYARTIFQRPRPSLHVWLKEYRQERQCRREQRQRKRRRTLSERAAPDAGFPLPDVPNQRDR